MNVPLRIKPLPLAEIVGVTPKLAEEWLKTMGGNRPISQQKVIEYGVKMAEGAWVLNGETIKFDDQGRLIDGQHRLQACALAGVTFRTHVIRGIEDKRAFATVDTGKTRSMADMFGIAGWQNNRTASGAALVIYAYENGRLAWKGVTGKYMNLKDKGQLAAQLKRGANASPVSREELVEFGNKLGQELQQAVRFANSSKASRVLPSASVAALYYLFRQRSPNATETFFTDLGEGVGLQRSDPVYVLREKLLRGKSDNAKLTRWVILGFVIKTWNRRRAHESAQVLRAGDGEQFPKVK